MLEERLNYIVRRQTAEILKTDQSVPFAKLLEMHLPAHLWDYLNVLLNPGLGGTVRIGGLALNMDDDQVVAGLEEKLMSDLIIDGVELEKIIRRALDTRISFLFDPAKSMSEIIFSRQPGKRSPAARVNMALEGLTRVVQSWDSRIAKAVLVIRDHLNQHPTEEITDVEFTRQLRAAIEKDFSQNPFQSVESSLLILQDVLKPAADLQGAEAIDFAEPACSILNGRGLMSWAPAVQVERELADRPLSLGLALKAMSRLRQYRERGVLTGGHEEEALIEEELAGFTSFVQGVS